MNENRVACFFDSQCRSICYRFDARKIFPVTGKTEVQTCDAGDVYTRQRVHFELYCLSCDRKPTSDRPFVQTGRRNASVTADFVFSNQTSYSTVIQYIGPYASFSR